MKTIFISCFFGLVTRNILRTNFFFVLRSRRNLRIVLLVPEGKKRAFQSEFDMPNVIIEGASYRSLKGISKLLHILSWHLLNTSSKKIHKLVQFHKDHSYSRYLITSFIAWCGRFVWVRKFFRFLDYWLVSKGTFDEWFNKYKPDLVLSTDPQDLRVQALSDSALIREARRRKIFTIGINRSWDSMTTKGLLRTLPDLLVVQTNYIRDQAIKYHSIDPQKIVVVGTPHYDSYLLDKRREKEELFRNLGLDPAKKTVLVALPSDIWTGDKSFNSYLLSLFINLEAQVIARFPLFGRLEKGDFQPPANIVFDIPFNTNQLEEAVLTQADDEHLADLMFHSDVIVTGPSSIILDAAVFNKPTILIGFDGVEPKPYYRALRRYYDYEHQSLIIAKGGIIIAKNGQELLSMINESLQNPQINEEKRRLLAKDVCLELDGHSGERLAQIVLSNL